MNDFDEVTQEASPPKFGLVDLVDAFTAFRHEYRSQVRQSRAATETLEAVAQQIERFSARLESHATESQDNAAPQGNADDSQTRLPLLLIDFDIQWTRAMEATIRHDDLLRSQHDAEAAEFQAAVAALSPLRRWMARPLIRRLEANRSAQQRPASAIGDGLTILLTRLRQLLDDNRIQRIETQGQPFDSSLMRSIGTVVDSSVPAGCVAQQFTPAYRWDGEVLKFADVRVAAAP